MTEIPPIGLDFLARYQNRTYTAAIGPRSDEVVLFSDTPQEGFANAGPYWRREVSRTELEWLALQRTVGAFGGEPCLVLDEDDAEGGLHIAYTGHNGTKAEALGYWLVDHGAYEVVVPREEVHSIRVDRVPIPVVPGQEPTDL